MNTLRERIIRVLTVSADELQTLEEIHAGHDDEAVKTLRGAREIVTHVVMHFASSAPSEIHALSAQTIRELADRLLSIGRTSGNELASQDLEHESTRLHQFLVSTGVDPDTEGKWRFRM